MKNVKVHIIKFNQIHVLRRVLFYFTIIYLILLAIFEKKINDPIVFVYIPLIVIGISMLILFQFLDSFNIVGSVILSNNGKCSVITNENNEEIRVDSLRLIYSGYTGKANPVWYVFSLSNVMSGAQNYLVLNNRNYQILIRKKTDLLSLLEIVSDLDKIGIPCETKKLRFSE
jgi:hypothetical protein